MSARDLFNHWDEVRTDLLRGLRRFSHDDLDFKPAPGYDRTAADIAIHIAGSEDGWINYVVRAEYDAWPQHALHAYPSWKSIVDLLEGVHAKTLRWLDQIDVADLDERYSTPWGTEVPLRWIIWHVLEHEIHHRGELYLCLGLLGKEAPDI